MWTGGIWGGGQTHVRHDARRVPSPKNTALAAGQGAGHPTVTLGGAQGVRRDAPDTCCEAPFRGVVAGIRLHRAGPVLRRAAPGRAGRGRRTVPSLGWG